jgi:1-acyl-sn-glycerol-3-phosphate acyltransferase
MPLLAPVLYRTRYEGLENFPREGPVILCANHTYMKDMWFIEYKLRRHVRWAAKKELFRNAFAAWVMRDMEAFPVDREHADMEAVKRMLDVLGKGHVLGLFPEATRVRDAGERPDANRGFVTIAAKTGAPVVPVACYYGRGPLGRSRFWSRIHVSFGQPVYMAAALRRDRAKTAWAAQAIMDGIYGEVRRMALELGEEPPASALPGPEDEDVEDRRASN